MVYRNILSFLLILLCVFTVEAALAREIAGHVVAVNGVLTAVSPGRAARTLERQSPFYTTDTLSTDKNSRAKLRFTDNTIIVLRKNTTFKVTAYQHDPKSAGKDNFVVDLIKGGFRLITGLIGKRSPKDFRVNTPVAVIGVRGTDFSTFFENNTLYSAVSDGYIWIRNNVDEILVGEAPVAPSSYAIVPGLNEKPYHVDSLPKQLQRCACVTAEPQEVTPEEATKDQFFLLADITKEPNAADLVTVLARSNRNPNTNEINIGTTNTTNLTTIEHHGKHQEVYATTYDTFGQINKEKGTFKPIGSFGTGEGKLLGKINFDHVVGLAYDDVKDILYALDVKDKHGILFQINPKTGAALKHVFADTDYLVLSGPEPLIHDVALASDPTTGILYGLARDPLPNTFTLVKINTDTGATTAIGKDVIKMPMTSMDFSPDGRLWALSNTEKATVVVEIDKETGKLSAEPPVKVDNGVFYPGLTSYQIKVEE